MITEKSPLLDRLSNFNTSGTADEIIIMMTEDKNNYYITASTHTRIYMIFLFTFTRNCQMVTIRIHYYKPALSIIDDDFIS